MNIHLNRIIKYLVLSDLIFYTGWGLISPIFAIFILQNISGGTALVVGLSSGIHLVTRSLLRIPFGVYADKSQKYAFKFMFFGLFVSALVPLGFIYSRAPMHIYLLQALLGVMLAMSTAGWTSIYSRHLDKGKESTEWGVDAVAVGIGPGIAGAVGGLAVTIFSFNLVFMAVSIIGLAGVVALLFVRKDVIKSKPLVEGHLFLPREARQLKKARFH